MTSDTVLDSYNGPGYRVVANAAHLTELDGVFRASFAAQPSAETRIGVETAVPT
ncbi:hypothetical protein Ato02nite_047990 [Paractinoplanes toevensis]|uniref:Uncharacterized protein n=1 Tax=Paractinoplanes toevensis TaxID=571911 RepID=A0A919W8B6_9ACTN|nr:hypothetical protein Ato02nite_047990 [Actinoplanes toevensis]